MKNIILFKKILLKTNRAKKLDSDSITKSTLTDWFTAILTVFTVLYALVSVFQLWFSATPYITISPGTAKVTIIQVGKPLQIDAGVIIYGQTPAKNASLIQRVLIVPPKTQLDWKFKLPTREEMMDSGIDFGQGTYPIQIVSSYNLDKNQVDDLYSGKKIIVVIGVNSYMDVFSWVYRKRFCMTANLVTNLIAVCKNSKLVD